MQAGDKYGRWTLNSYTGGNKPKWNCTCECGTIRDVRQDCLKDGTSKSCGCLHREISAELVVKHSRKHGMYGTSAYNIYATLKSRCTNPNNEKFPVYSVLEHDISWFESFDNFWSDMGASYFEGASIDRVDNNKGYTKENSRWVVPDLQARNRKKTKRNTSGSNGVFWDVKDGTTYAKVVFYEEGKQKTKSFSVKKYGLLEAFALACAYRKEQIDRLNSLGYGYTETHGL